MKMNRMTKVKVTIMIHIDMMKANAQFNMDVYAAMTASTATSSKTNMSMTMRMDVSLTLQRHIKIMVKHCTTMARTLMMKHEDALDDDDECTCSYEGEYGYSGWHAYGECEHEHMRV